MAPDLHNRQGLMKIRLIPSNSDGNPVIQYLTSLLIDQSLLIDAGSAGFTYKTFSLRKLKNIFISHAHMDHIASLPSLLEAYLANRLPPPTIWTSSETIQSLKLHLFNNQLWPDFFSLGSKELPWLNVRESSDFLPIELDGLRVTPIPVNHVIKTQGYMIESSDATILISSDTGPTQAIWEIANQQKRLDAIILEVAFPKRLQGMADLSCHLTPKTFGLELAKLKNHNPVILAVHLKPLMQSTIINELHKMNLDQLVVMRSDHEYCFPS
jgi:cAMP phosphodiesterase